MTRRLVTLPHGGGPPAAPTYRVSVVLTPDTGGYVATVPALRGCISEGDTIEDALANITEALAGVLASYPRGGIPWVRGAADGRWWVFVEVPGHKT